MRFFIAILILVISLNSCKSTQSTNKETLNVKTISLKDGCPDNGDCAFEVMKNTQMRFQKEESTGKLQPKFETDSTQNVIKFTFDKNQDQAAVDGQYREEVYFELPKGKSVLNLKDGELSQVHFLYGRFCFCSRNSTGYFKVDNGKLKVKNGKLSFDFENGQVPQVLGKVSARYE